jgi:hypothetical protein
MKAELCISFQKLVCTLFRSMKGFSYKKSPDYDKGNQGSRVTITEA